VVGLDSDLHVFTWRRNLSGAAICKDTRDVKINDLEGFDAVLHLAALSMRFDSPARNTRLLEEIDQR
jgi:hypothetical protein